MTDASIEVVPPGATEPVLVWIWECIDYGHSVPVDDVEEFHAKLEQVGVHETPGGIASRSGFDQGAVACAAGWKIALAHFATTEESISVYAQRSNDRTPADALNR